MQPFRKIRPLRLDETGPGEILIEWDDGFVSRHTYRMLRYHCACAQCRDEATGRRLIEMENVAADIRPLGVAPVGTYALRFDWSDGHSTGLYSFDMLREHHEPLVAPCLGRLDPPPRPEGGCGGGCGCH